MYINKIGTEGAELIKLLHSLNNVEFVILLVSQLVLGNDVYVPNTTDKTAQEL